MNKTITGILYLMTIGVASITLSCGGEQNSKLSIPDEELVETSSVPGTESEIPMKEIRTSNKIYNVADISDESHIYKKDVNRDNCVIVISKREFRLYMNVERTPYLPLHSLFATQRIRALRPAKAI